MARKITSVSKLGLTEPFEFQVAEGQIAYHTSEHRSGPSEACILI